MMGSTLAADTKGRWVQKPGRSLSHQRQGLTASVRWVAVLRGARNRFEPSEMLSLIVYTDRWETRAMRTKWSDANIQRIEKADSRFCRRSDAHCDRAQAKVKKSESGRNWHNKSGRGNWLR
jgi:hypothetical protein